jgi:energy-coupling factor transporter transmembrane protein EcfT
MSQTAFDFQRTGDTRRYPMDAVNPLVLLVGILVPAFTALAITDLRSALVCVALIALSLPLLRSRPRTMLLRIGVALFLFATVAWSNWYIGSRDLEVAVTAGIRVFSVATPGLLFSAHVRPFELGDALIQLLRLPPRPILAIVMALQRAQFLAEQWSEIGLVRRARGVGGVTVAGTVRELGGRTLVFLVIAIRSATDLSIAMDIRGMLAWRTRSVARGHWDTSVWRVRDTVAVAVIGLVAAVPIVLAFL